MPKGKRVIVNPGVRFGRLTIEQEVKTRNWVRRFLCKCDCGKETIVQLGALRNGSIISCGCYRRENNGRLIAEHNKTHCLSKSRVYNIWCGMKSRCYNPNDTAYKNYGGRGISICDEWLGKNGFKTFHEWALKNGYAATLTIERINHEGGYWPDNCTWISREDQAKNTRRNVMVNLDGENRCLSEWCRVLSISESTIYKRLGKGWSAKDSLTRPIRFKRDGRSGRSEHY